MKRCTRCHQLKPITDFSHDRSKKHGRRADCKSCAGPISRKWLQNNPARMKVYNRRQFLRRMAREHANWLSCAPTVDHAPIPAGMKRCRQCQIVKVLTEFHQRRREHDGRNYYCKSCVEKRGNLYYTKYVKQILERAHEYYEIHQVERQAYNQHYWQANKEELSQENHERYVTHIDRHRGYGRAYAKRYPEKMQANKRARQARIKGAIAVERFTVTEIWLRDGKRCHLCQKGVARTEASVDHLIPVSDKRYFPTAGHTRQNVALAHIQCNKNRGDGRIPAQLRLLP
jgi:5-methylcytosine-specific restriction endonuclease McrA